MNFSIKNILKLLGICLCLWFFFAVITPILEDHIPAWKRYNEIQDEKGLDSGAIYYSDVPQIQEAEERMREAVEKGISARREARKQK
ncbi:MAG: hypothetical protein HDQ93_03900 [Desulfovibrio sp.]|nr:hypothetical protein [Desulfovibrio sp.]